MAPDRPSTFTRDPQSAEAERRFVQGMAARDPAAVEEFLDRTHHAVFSLACRLTANGEDRRDWCHDTLLGIMDDVSNGRFVYTRPGSFWAWFRKRAWFRLLDAYRRTRRHEQRELLFGETEVEEELPGRIALPAGSNPARDFEAVRLRTAVEDCLGKIPSREQRQALEILLFQDGTYEDVAAALASPLNTVKAWIRRGRLALRKCLSASLALEDV